MPILIILNLIASEVPTGKGTTEDPCRLIYEWHTTTGRLFLSWDPYTDVCSDAALAREILSAANKKRLDEIG